MYEELEREIDIRTMPEIIQLLNKALNDNKIIEIKNESSTRQKVNIVVVQIDRKVLTRKK